uniref:Uncharacterized protein n=1 Tax=Leptospira santarosai serovar Arenal str. MAVJ 401 TaxID=1049976 RepID=M6JR97_9LEPT|nr:hypothetical protein LEP1GSC063_3221 [Leptospira santarosai serovar Arenal str. MAVJ 401]
MKFSVQERKTVNVLSFDEKIFKKLEYSNFLNLCGIGFGETMRIKKEFNMKALQ